jgi:hypothetical protein
MASLLEPNPSAGYSWNPEWARIDDREGSRHELRQGKRRRDGSRTDVSIFDKEGVRAWKTFAWEITDRLFEKGYISDPKGPAKSVSGLLSDSTPAAGLTTSEPGYP